VKKIVGAIQTKRIKNIDYILIYEVFLPINNNVMFAKRSAEILEDCNERN
jgi:hypothetical protein